MCVINILIQERFKRTLNYRKRKALSHPTHMMSTANLMAIYVETLRIDIGCSLEKEFAKLVHINP